MNRITRVGEVVVWTTTAG